MAVSSAQQLKTKNLYFVPMKTMSLFKMSLSLTCLCTEIYAHDHMPAGATTNTPGATLEYAPSAQDFTTNSGFVFSLTAGTTNDPYLGYYYTSVVFRKWLDILSALFALFPDRPTWLKLFQPLARPFHFRHYFFHGRGPYEGPGGLVPGLEELLNCLL